MIKLIVAYDDNLLIGKDDKLVWNIKEDLIHFKNETINKTILFGDVTFLGIGKPLPNRKTIVLTLDKDFKYDHKDVQVINSYSEIVKKYQGNKNEDIYICGGATIYRLFIPFMDEIIVSKIKGNYEGNKYFPNWNLNEFILYEKKNYDKFIVERYIRKDLYII